MRPGDKLIEMAARYRRRPAFVSAVWDGEKLLCETWWTPKKGLVRFYGDASAWTKKEERKHDSWKSLVAPLFSVRQFFEKNL